MNTGPNGTGQAKTDQQQTQDRAQQTTDESPQNLPKGAWATLIVFAIFVVSLAGCWNTFMFN